MLRNIRLIMQTMLAVAASMFVVTLPHQAPAQNHIPASRQSHLGVSRSVSATLSDEIGKGCVAGNTIMANWFESNPAQIYENCDVNGNKWAVFYSDGGEPITYPKVLLQVCEQTGGVSRKLAVSYSESYAEWVIECVYKN